MSAATEYRRNGSRKTGQLMRCRDVILGHDLDLDLVLNIFKSF